MEIWSSLTPQCFHAPTKIQCLKNCLLLPSKDTIYLFIASKSLAEIFRTFNSLYFCCESVSLSVSSVLEEEARRKMRSYCLTAPTTVSWAAFLSLPCTPRFQCAAKTLQLKCLVFTGKSCPNFHETGQVWSKPTRFASDIFFSGKIWLLNSSKMPSLKDTSHSPHDPTHMAHSAPDRTTKSLGHFVAPTPSLPYWPLF